MMLVVHIWANQLDNWIVFNGHRLWNYLTVLSNPVAFFLFLGGYGLYRVREKGGNHRYSRLLRLYIHFWIILLIFVLLSISLKASPMYPVHFKDVIMNFSSFHVSWNPVCQFLLPYVLLSLSYPFLFRLLDKMGILFVGGLSY